MCRGGVRVPSSVRPLLGLSALTVFSCEALGPRQAPGRRGCLNPERTVWNGLAQGCLRLSMENGRVLAPFLSAWVSEDE